MVSCIRRVGGAEQGQLHKKGGRGGGAVQAGSDARKGVGGSTSRVSCRSME